MGLISRVSSRTYRYRFDKAMKKSKIKASKSQPKLTSFFKKISDKSSTDSPKPLKKTNIDNCRNNKENRHPSAGQFTPNRLSQKLGDDLKVSENYSDFRITFTLCISTMKWMRFIF